MRVPFMSLVVAVLLSLPAPRPAQARGLPRDVSYNDLLVYLKEGGVDARREACKRIGERRSPDAVPDVGRVVTSDAVAKVREQCLEALADIGSPAGARFAREAALKDEDRSVRIDALRVLAKLDPKEGAGTAVKVLTADRDPEVRKRALWAIEHRGWTSAGPAVAQVALHDPSADLRRAALKALKEIGTDEGYRAIAEVMLHDALPEVRREAVEMLERNPRKSVLGALCQALKDRDRRVAKNAAKAIGELGLREGARCLREASRDVRDDDLAGDMNKIAGRLER